MNKVKKKKQRTETEENMEEQPDYQTPSHKVEYTEVFINKDGNITRPLLRRQTPVEYCSIVPIKGLADDSNREDEQRPSSEIPRFKIEESVQKIPHLEENTSATEGESHLYENVATNTITPKTVFFSFCFSTFITASWND